MANVGGRFLPGGELAVNRAALEKCRGIVRREEEPFAAGFVGDANLELLEGVEAVEGRNGEFVDAVHHARVAGGHGVEPAAAAGAGGGGGQVAAPPDDDVGGVMANSCGS